jgi:LmbE family N-acetylglucosaminyl deacetylase
VKERIRFLCLGLALCSAIARAQTPDPLADHGAAALRRSLLELSTTASLLQVTAHPDDEDGGLLTLLSRGRGVRVGLVTLTRGEGGQNKIGPELFDALGVTRTEELLASDRHYGVEQFFTRAVDYGFSKTLAEALQKWRFADADGGPVVGDLVRVIRRFRPDVLVARFSGTRRDGHAHHEASSILARKAFEEAGDPSKFPEQIREGLLPWKPKKLYAGIFRANEDWTVTEDVGAYDPLLGTSYAQLAWQGLSRQRTQGVGQVQPDPGARPVYYRRIDGTPAAAVLDVAGKVEPPYHEGKAASVEKGFFDGMDDSLTGIAAAAGADSANSSFLASGLAAIARDVETAAGRFDAARPDRCAEPLARGLSALAGLTSRIEASTLPADRKAAVIFLLRIKRDQFREALNHAYSLALVARLEPDKEPGSPFPGFRFAVETARVAVPGGTYSVSVSLSNRSDSDLRITEVSLAAPPGWKVEAVSGSGPAALAARSTARALFKVTVAADAPPTAPFWHRPSVEDAVYQVDDPRRIGDPLPPFPLEARVRYAVGDAAGAIEGVVQTRTLDPLRGELSRELAVEPAISLRTNPPLVVMPLDRVGRGSAAVTVEVTTQAGKRAGKASIQAPAGWPAVPPQPFAVDTDHPAASLRFSVSPPAGTRPGLYPLEATADGENQTLDFIEHPDIGPFYFVKPARTRLEVLDLKVPERLSIGYVRGAEDSIPEFLQQLGIDVHLLAPDDLDKGDLSGYSTIVTGPRAYDVREDLRRDNGRLLDYVRRGGRLVVQYNSGTRAFNAGNYFPFPAKFPDDNLRVTVEDSPVEMLSPGHSIWNHPNRITAKDFDGWVQERGLYFVGEWSPDYTPLLSMHDPGEPALTGGLLVATVGKGTYVFTGESWFRELPEGVAGAIRIFVNLISPAPAR